LKTYDPVIDFIRFVAFFLVFIRHFVLNGGEGIVANNDSWWSLEIIQRLAYFGGQGVTLFFGITGFLISRLLIREFNEKAGIDIKKFYYRRVLRIWPLYFLFIVLCGVFNLLSKSPTLTYREVPYLLTFTYNWGLILERLTGSMASITWSISVEEQIYLIFPLLFILFVKNILRLAISLILIGFSSAIACIYIWNLDPHRFTLVYLLPFGVGLIVAIYENKILEVRTNFWIQILLILLIIAYALTYRDIASFVQIYTFIPSALLFPVLFFVLKSFNLEYRSLFMRAAVYIGRRSYGGYLFHWMLWVIMLGRAPTILNDKDGFTLFGVLFAFVTTVGVSSFSYKFLESPFLNYRKRFQRVVSP
jgi:peptidoglycan/LPS O-acetylase OafA/YrhL